MRTKLAALGVALAVVPGLLAPSQARAQSRASGVDTTSLDRTVRPQDDFYRFANGGWIRRTEIPADRSRWGTFDELAGRTAAQVRTLIEEAAASPDAPAGSELRKVGDFYRAYMDTARIEALGLAPLRGELARIEAVRSVAELPAAFARHRTPPVSLFATPDAKAPDRHVLRVSQSYLLLPARDYYLSDAPRYEEARRGYLAYLERVLTLAGWPDPAGAAARVLALETRLAARQWDRARLRDPGATYNKVALERLDGELRTFSVSRFIRAAGVASPVDSILVSEPDYLAAVDTIVAGTPIGTWRDYLASVLLTSYAPYLPRAFAPAHFDFFKRTLEGVQEPAPRWQRGVKAVESALGEAVGRLYVERHFRADARVRMRALVDRLLEAFRQGIDELEWMSPATRVEAHAKLAAISVEIGHPAKWRDYSSLEVRPGDLAGNIMRSRAFFYAHNLSRLGQPVDRGEWYTLPQTVNAFYNAGNNQIIFPAGLLQPPFFDVAADDAVNYGAIGAFIGHEISHGFDDKGRRFDGTGRLRDWWAPEDAAAFDARAQKLVAQFSAYEPLEGVRINGKLGLGENIADLSGLTVAHRAYRASLGGGEAPVVDGFTGDQRFFLGWAQVWRIHTREATLRRLLLTDGHSPEPYRTLGPLSNMDAFYRAFGVEEGDGMWRAPSERTRIW